MKKIYVILLAMFLVLAVAGCSSSAKTPDGVTGTGTGTGTGKAPERITPEQCWAYDPYNQTEKYIGLVDYVFVAEVVEQMETFFDKKAGEPVQTYKVKVKENIKGKFSTDELINVYAYGGVTPDGKHEYDYGFNNLKGGTYIIAGLFAEEDTENYKKGSLFLDIDIDLPKDYKGSEAYSKWVKAYENEVPFKGFGDE